MLKINTLPEFNIGYFISFNTGSNFFVPGSTLSPIFFWNRTWLVLSKKAGIKCFSQQTVLFACNWHLTPAVGNSNESLCPVDRHRQTHPTFFYGVLYCISRPFNGTLNDAHDDLQIKKSTHHNVMGVLTGQIVSGISIVKFRLLHHMEQGIPERHLSIRGTSRRVLR